MFWPWSDDASLYVSGETALFRDRRIGKTRVTRAGDAASIVAAVRDDAPAPASPRRRRIRVLLGSAEILLARIEGIDGLQTRADWLALARQRLLTEMGRDEADWQAAFDLLPGRQSAIACAAPRQRLAELTAELTKAGWHVTTVQPAALVWAQGWVTANRGATALVLEEPGAVASFHGRDAALSALTFAAADARDAARTEQERLSLVLDMDAGTIPRLRFDVGTSADVRTDNATQAWLAFLDRLEATA